MKKFRFLAVVLTVCLLAGMFTGCRFIKEGPLATVNGEEITKGVYALYLLQAQNQVLSQAGITTAEDALAYWESTNAEGVKNEDHIKTTAMDDVILLKIKCQKAAELNVSLSDEEKAQISQQINDQITGMGGNSVFQSQLKAFGSDPESYTAFIEMMTLASKVDEAIKNMPEYNVTEEQAKENIKNTYIKAKHILISTIDETTGASLGEEAFKEAKKKADDIYKQLKDGADFDKLMNENSEDPGLQSSPDGYVFGKKQMVPEFEETAYALKEGEFSKPVETSFGYHIIKREPVKISDAEIEEYLATELQLMQYDKLENLYNEWKESSKAKVNKKQLANIAVIK